MNTLMNWKYMSKTLAFWALVSMSFGTQASELLPAPPLVIDPVSQFDKPMTLHVDGKDLTLTVEPYLQRHLEDYIKNHFSPIAAAVVVEAKTGRILAIAQGKSPDKWGAQVHSTLHNLFPAASLFKTVSATAAIEVVDMDPNRMYSLHGGCGEVHSSGVWLQDLRPKRNFQMSLKRAYGLSCNGFFAKIAVNQLGLGTVLHYANLYGWNQTIPADFEIPVSPMKAPDARTASVLSIGKFNAGFGYVGISAMHAAWMMLTLARDGESIPLRLYEQQVPYSTMEALPRKQVFQKKTAHKMRSLMNSTLRGGTANFAFEKRKFWKIRDIAGGKTGTLTGENPKGMTTWFAGMMPLDEPEIIVAAVVILEDLWHIKGSHVAAEAFYAYRLMQQSKKSLSDLSNTAKSEVKEAAK